MQDRLFRTLRLPFTLLAAAVLSAASPATTGLPSIGPACPPGPAQESEHSCAELEQMLAEAQAEKSAADAALLPAMSPIIPLTKALKDAKDAREEAWDKFVAAETNWANSCAGAGSGSPACLAATEEYVTTLENYTATVAAESNARAELQAANQALDEVWDAIKEALFKVLDLTAQINAQCG